MRNKDWCGDRCGNRFRLGLQLQASFNSPLQVMTPVADPEITDLLPCLTTRLDREPRPRHQVRPLQSQTRPQIVATNPLDRTADDQWLEVMHIKCEFMTPVEWDCGRWQ